MIERWKKLKAEGITMSRRRTVYKKQNHSEQIKAKWKKRKEEDPDKIAKLFKAKSEQIKMKEDNISRTQLQSETMKNYGKRVKDGRTTCINRTLGVTKRPKRIGNFYWTEERKRNHGEWMKQKWEQLDSGIKEKKRKEHSKKMKAYWKLIIKKGDTSQRRLKQSLRMKAYWVKKRQDGSWGNMSQAKKEKHRQVMKRYWKKKMEEGNTEREMKIREKVRRYWRAIRDRGKFPRDRIMQFIKQSKVMKQWWRKPSKAGGRSRIHEHSDTMLEFWREELEQYGYDISYFGSEEFAKRIREFWRRTDLETGTDRRRRLSAKLKSYWGKIGQKKLNWMNKTTTWKP
ncbi:hypothetical protein WDU94_003076 [Cyamophila willieti]